MKELLEKREDGKYKLVENVLIPSFMIKQIPLKESERVIERNGKTYKCVAAYSFPVSRPNQENLNGRIYSQTLWENVIAKKQGEGKFGLCDHPENEGSVKDAFTVWHNVRLSEKKDLVYADAYLFGEWGRHAKEAIDAGGQIGISSVGFGDFESDNKTVEASSYELDRPGDWVLNPSYEVFGNMQDEISPSIVDKKEEVIPPEINSKLLEETDTINKDNDQIPNIEGDKIMSENKKVNSLEEKNFKLSVKNMFKEATVLPTVEEQLNSSKELLTYFEDFSEDFALDLKEEIKGFVELKQTELSELAKKGMQTDTLLESNTSLSDEVSQLREKVEVSEKELVSVKEEYERAVDLLDSMKEYTVKLKELYELEKSKAESMVKVSEYKELMVYAEELEKELQESKVKMNKMRKEMKIMRRHIEDEDITGKAHSMAGEEDGYTDEDPDGSVSGPDGPSAELDREGEPTGEVDENPQGGHMPGAGDGSFPDAGDSSGTVIESRKRKRIEFFSPDVEEYYLDLEEANPAVVKIKKDLSVCRTVAEAQLKYFRLKSLVEDEDFYSVDRREINRLDENRKAFSTKNNLRTPKNWF